MGWKERFTSLVDDEDSASSLLKEYTTKGDMAEAISSGPVDLAELSGSVESQRALAELFELEIEDEVDESSDDEDEVDESSDDEEELKEKPVLMGLNIRNLDNQKREIAWTDNDGIGKTLVLQPNAMVQGVPAEIVRSPHFQDLLNNQSIIKVGTSPLREH